MTLLLAPGTAVKVVSGPYTGRLGKVRAHTHVGLDPEKHRRLVTADQMELHLVDFTDRDPDDEPDPISGPYQWFKPGELETVA